MAPSADRCFRIRPEAASNFALRKRQAKSEDLVWKIDLALQYYLLEKTGRPYYTYAVHGLFFRVRMVGGRFE